MMNTLHKSLTIAILAVSIFISGINLEFVDAHNTVRSIDEDRSGALWVGTIRSVGKIIVC